MDGEVSIGDVTTLVDYMLSGDIIQFDAVAADVNQDETISIGDVTALIDMLLNPSAAAVTKQWDAMPTTGGILIENPVGELIEIYNLDGDCIATITGEGAVELAAGIYVVATDDMSRKVVVK